MSTLGVMLEATYALYGMEMSYAHRPVAGRDNCALVKWTDRSLTQICWFADDENRVEFSTRIHLPEDGQLDDYERLADLLNSVDPLDEESLRSTRHVRLEKSDLVIESKISIADVSYVGEVEQAYTQALQEVMSIEAAIA